MSNLLINFYQRVISPILHAIGRTAFGPQFNCRFTPTCSEYTKIAIHRYGIIHGGWLGIKRVVRCQPFSVGGHDPVPDKI